VRYEIAISESAAGCPVGAEVLAIQSVRLRQREQCRASGGDRRSDQDRAIRASFGNGPRSPENDRAGNADTESTLGKPVVRSEQGRRSAPEQEEHEQSVNDIK